VKARNIAIEALDEFGFEGQLLRLAEEASEVAKAALKLHRGLMLGHGCDQAEKDLIAEMGDYRLVEWQMEKHVGRDRIKSATRRSALKLEKLIGDYRADQMRRGLGPIPPLDADLYEIKECGCCARPKALGRGLDAIIGGEHNGNG
jgi:hypothetical protein